jgi:hypothetical protein
MATPTNLPATFVAGNILTAAQQNALRGAFRVLQVVSGTTSTGVSNATTTLATTGLTASITPQFNTSKILVVASMTSCKVAAINTGIEFAFLRGSTNVLTFSKFAGFGTASTDNNFSITGLLYDSPATTSATSYTVHFARGGGSGTVEVQQGSLTTSTILLMEISA